MNFCDFDPYFNRSMGRQILLAMLVGHFLGGIENKNTRRKSRTNPSPGGCGLLCVLNLQCFGGKLGGLVMFGSRILSDVF